LVLFAGAGESVVSAVEEAEVAFGIVRAEGGDEPEAAAASVVAVVECGSVVIVCEHVAIGTVVAVPSAVLGPE
jgi:hypothetical protein